MNCPDRLGLHPGPAMCGRAPSLLRRQRDQARLLDPAGSGHPKRRAQLERGADQLLLVVRYNTRAGERSLDVMLWGLVPLGLRTSKVGFANINAKAEEIEGRPALREAFQPPGSHGPRPSHFEAGGAAPQLRDRKLADSSVEGNGFEPSVPRCARTADSAAVGVTPLDPGHARQITPLLLLGALVQKVMRGDDVHADAHAGQRAARHLGISTHKKP